MSEGEFEPERGTPRRVPPPRPVRRPRRGPLPPDRQPVTPTSRDTDPDEPDWKRERREEAEFRAQFGDWRGGPVRRRPPLVLLLALLVILALAAVLLWS